MKLLIEIVNQDTIDEEPSNYDDDFEEPVEEAPKKVFKDPITFDEVKSHFELLRFVLMIKKVKKTDALKFILHGLRDQESNKKLKKITIQDFVKCIDEKIDFADKGISMKIAKHLIEVPNEDGKIEMMDDADFKGQTHAEAVSIKRKDLDAKFNELINNYPIFNGIAITSLLSQIQNMFESVKEQLASDLED